LLEEAEARGYQCDAQAGFARCIATLEGQAAALEHAQQVWDFLWENGSAALEFPFLAYLTCMNIFTVHEPKTADRVLETGCQDLIRRAEKISDPEWRQIYLHGIPEHKTFMSLRRNQK
jgi:hypothetical protein